MARAKVEGKIYGMRLSPLGGKLLERVASLELRPLNTTADIIIRGHVEATYPELYKSVEAEMQQDKA